MEPTEAEILFAPARTVTVAGEELAVRELTYGQSLRILPDLQPLIAEMGRMMRAQAEGEDLDIDPLICMHPAAWAALTAAAVGRPIGWIESLADADGLALQTAAWAANSGFFARRLMLGAAIRMGMQPGAKTSPISSSD